MIVALAAAFLIGIFCGVPIGLHLAHAVVPEVLPALPPSDFLPRPTLYEIRRDTKLLWQGTDGQAAKLWWEHAKAQPGDFSLAFTADGVPRDAFTTGPR